MVYIINLQIGILAYTIVLNEFDSILVYTREADNFLVHLQNQVYSLESYSTVLTKVISI